MSTETYVYDDATGSTILSKIKTKTDFLHLPSKDAKSRDSERERKRLIGYDLHCATLGEYHRQGKIPRGLRCNLRPTLFSENEKYCATFQKILNKCSFDIILLTIEYLQEAIKATEEKIESIETQLTSTLNSTEFTTLKNKVDSILTVHQKTLEDRKRTKFQRDIEDYLTNNVYKWEDPFPRRPRPRYRRTPGNYHSGGSSPAGGSSAGSGSETELKVLNMGLSFCPTPKWDSFQLERDLQQFYRNIRLKVYFEESTNFPGPVSTPAQTEGPILTIDQLGLRNRSTFVPPKSSHAVETFVNLLDRDVKRTLHDQRLGFLPVRHNLDPLEKQALDSLSGNKNIIIKPADKGGAIVVMDKSFYMTETCGTAMGSNVAPAYANLYMDRFEKEYVYPDPNFQQHAYVLTHCTNSLNRAHFLDGLDLERHTPVYIRPHSSQCMSDQMRIMTSKELAKELRHRSGQGYQRISAVLKVPKSTVASKILKRKKFGTTRSLPRPGCPAKLSNR
ncbi:unnamed protein product, partial [Ranitomeya imitator]